MLSRAFQFLLVFLMTISVLPAAQAQVLETGWLLDQKGATDPKTKISIVLVTNLNGMQGPDGSMKWAGRHIGLQIPLPKIDVNKIIIIGEDGKPMPHRHPEAWEELIGPDRVKGTYLKLFVDRPPGFKFRLRVEQ